MSNEAAGAVIFFNWETKWEKRVCLKLVTWLHYSCCVNCSLVVFVVCVWGKKKALTGRTQTARDPESSFRVNLLCDFGRLCPGWSLSASVWEWADDLWSSEDALWFCFIAILRIHLYCFLMNAVQNADETKQFLIPRTLRQRNWICSVEFGWGRHGGNNGSC